MPYFNKSQIEQIISHAVDAGEMAQHYQQSGDFEVFKKPDGSSVTSADIAISKLINDKLSGDFPDIPIICEEGTLRQADNTFWLIDPIDGTNSFIKGSSQFAINIALIKDKKAVFGLIYAPSFEGGKLAFSDEHDQVVVQNNKSIISKTYDHSNNDKLKLITSSRINDADIAQYIQQYAQDYVGNYSVEKLSSAVKFFRILERQADLYLHNRQSMEWDIASGQNLIELMGGKVKKLLSNDDGFIVGGNMVYAKPDFVNSPFIASINQI